MGVPTLSDFFYDHYIPEVIDPKQLDHKTRSSYCETIGWWVKLTGDPPLNECDGNNKLVAQFLTLLGKQKGKKEQFMMRSSIGKHAVNLKSVFRFAGPPTDSCDGQDFIKRVPFFRVPRVELEPPGKDWSIDEIRALVINTHVATKPDNLGISPELWWRGLISFAYSTGMRITATVSVEFENLNGQWLTVPAKYSKGKRGKKQFIRPDVLEVIEQLRQPGRTKIFGWSGTWERRRRIAYDQFREIQEAAGIPVHRRWGFQSFRKTHLTMLASGDIDPNAGIRTAQQSAGHSNSGITTSHYISGTVQDRLVASAIAAMPSPFPLKQLMQVISA